MAPKLTYDPSVSATSGSFGLLVGAACEDRVAVWRGVPTPQDPAADGAAQLPSTSWAGSHAIEVRKMLPGGADVVGVYVSGTAQEIARCTLNVIAVADAIGTSLVLTLVAEAAGSKAEFKTAERGKLIAKPARALSADEVTKRLFLAGEYAVDVLIRYDGKVDPAAVDELARAVDVVAAGTEGPTALEGSVQFGKVAVAPVAADVVQVELLSSRAVHVVGDGDSVVRLRTLCDVCVCFPDRDVEAGAVRDALRADLARSLRTRLELSLQENAAGPVPSRRQFLDGLWWSDYYFPEETGEDSRECVATLVGLGGAGDGAGDGALERDERARSAARFKAVVARSSELPGGTILYIVAVLVVLLAALVYR